MLRDQWHLTVIFLWTCFTFDGPLMDNAILKGKLTLFFQRCMMMSIRCKEYEFFFVIGFNFQKSTQSFLLLTFLSNSFLSIHPSIPPCKPPNFDKPDSEFQKRKVFCENYKITWNWLSLLTLHIHASYNFGKVKNWQWIRDWNVKKVRCLYLSK